MPVSGSGFQGVLEGLLVIDFTQAIAGPLATRVLGEMGARVVKIEAPRGDLVRRLQWRPGQAWGPMFGHGSAGKESLCVDMRHPQGRDVVDRLLDVADIVVENFRPGVMEQWGFDPKALIHRRRHPVVCSVSGFGRGTEQSGWSATDPLGQAFSGMTYMLGTHDEPPLLAANGIADSATAMSAAAGILAAVIGRMKDGQGRYVDIAMADAMLAMDCVNNPVAAAFPDVEWKPLGHDHPAVCPFGVFRASDGYVVIQGLGQGPDSTWGRLCAAVGQAQLVDDERTRTDASRLLNRPLVNDPIARWIAERSRDEVVRVLQAAGALAGPVHSPREAVTHPFYRQRGSVQPVDTGVEGVPPREMVAMPFFPSGISAAPRRPPMLGEHNREVLQSLLGMTAAEVDRLHNDAVVLTQGDWP
jgi:crotonobetainyl-CoA:carnitine CoA-transferase CaiB-like acyl-CoA transferase